MSDTWFLLEFRDLLPKLRARAGNFVQRHRTQINGPVTTAQGEPSFYELPRKKIYVNLLKYMWDGQIKQILQHYLAARR